MTAARAQPVLYLVVCAAPPTRAIHQLVELLQRDGWTVCVIATPTAASWLDTAALAEQTGQPVRYEYKHPDDPDVLPHADAIVIAPATFNTVNKWAAGISDTFALGILNEALGLRLPIVVAPHAKASLAAHPAFQDGLNRLAGCGVTLLENELLKGLDDADATSTFNWSPLLDELTAHRPWPHLHQRPP